MKRGIFKDILAIVCILAVIGGVFIQGPPAASASASGISVSYQIQASSDDAEITIDNTDYNDTATGDWVGRDWNANISMRAPYLEQDINGITCFSNYFYFLLIF